MIQQFWQEQQRIMETGEVDLRKHELPLARIKKVMKTDDDVRTKMVIQPTVVLNLSYLFFVDDQCRSTCSICKSL